MEFPRLARALVSIVALGALTAACSGADDPATGPPMTGESPSAEPDTDSPLAFPAYRDTATPIWVAVGQQFALALDADPRAGERWRLANPPDPSVLVPLGNERRPLAGDGDDRLTQLLLFAAAGEGETTVEVILVGPDGAPVGDREPLVFVVGVSLSGEAPQPEPDPDADSDTDPDAISSAATTR
jgi:hypothetical protein